METRRITVRSTQFRQRADGPDLAELAARKFVESHGGDALSILGERAALAEERGHKVAARTWCELAEIAAAILGAAPPGGAGRLAATGAGWHAAPSAALRDPNRRA